MLLAILLLLQMMHLHIPDQVHEIGGVLLGVVLVVHLVLNRRWFLTLRRGRWTAQRVMNALVLAAICACIVAMLASGLAMSSWAAAGGVHGAGIARAIHLPLVHIGFCLMAIHAGMQMQRAVPVFRKGLPPSGLPRICAVLLCVALVAFAIWSLADLRFVDYITGRVGFAFMETTKPALLDLAEYAAIFLAFALLGHVISRAAKSSLAI